MCATVLAVLCKQVIFRIQATAASTQHATCIAARINLHLQSHLLPPGSDVCEAHFSLVLFPDTPEALVDAVVNPSSPSRRTGLSYAIPHRATPPGSTYMYLSVCQLQSLTRSCFLFTCLHPPTLSFCLRLRPILCQVLVRTLPACPYRQKVHRIPCLLPTPSLIHPDPT